MAKRHICLNCEHSIWISAKAAQGMCVIQQITYLNLTGFAEDCGSYNVWVERGDDCDKFKLSKYSPVDRSVLYRKKQDKKRRQIIREVKQVFDVLDK